MKYFSRNNNEKKKNDNHTFNVILKYYGVANLIILLYNCSKKS